MYHCGERTGDSKFDWVGEADGFRNLAYKQNEQNVPSKMPKSQAYKQRLTKCLKAKAMPKRNNAQKKNAQKESPKATP